MNIRNRSIYAWFGQLSMAGLGLLLCFSSVKAAPPTGEVNALLAKRKSTKTIEAYIRVTFALGRLYRKHKAYNKALQLYAALGKKYEKRQVLCGVYHFRAQSFLKLNQSSAAIAEYKKLMRLFQRCQCPYLTNAYIAMGRLAFDQKDYNKALSQYRKAPRCRENRIGAIAAEYMKSWCAYKLGKYRPALRSMTRALQEMRRNRRRFKGEQKTKMLEVQKEAWPNFVRTYSRAGNPKNALRTFRKMADRKQADKMVEQLASSYYTTKAYKKLIALYSTLARRQRRSPRTVLYWLEILRAAHRTKNERLLFRALSKLASSIKKHRSQAGSNKDLQKHLKASQKQIRKFAKFKHSKAQKLDLPKLYKQAETFFATYRGLYPQSDDANIMAFWHGEVLLELQKYRKAARAYHLAARHPKPFKFTEDSTYKAALANHRYLENAQSIQYKAPPKRKRLRRIPIPGRYETFLEAGTFFRTKYPHNKHVPSVVYNMGLVYQKFWAFEKARDEFLIVCTKYPKHKYARPAAKHIVDTLRIRQKWTLLADAVDKILAVPELGRPRFKRRLKEVGRAAHLNSCYTIMKAKEYLKAGACYYAVSKKLGEHRETPLVLYNAYVAYYNGQNVPRANKIKAELLKRFPRSRAARTLDRRNR
ncbi:MAG: hypothetical protein EP343_25575 [Deltaproteobacteria bacterium]|nr:MAG: hypothetical protein EP343_25575 [Deltaproteobacteria bacterium]